MKKIAFFTLITLIPFLMGCNEINLTMDDTGKTVNVKKGDKISITLVSNRSTGNTWRNIEYDNKIIEQDGEPEYKASSSKLVGAPGKVTYKFKAIAKGKTKLKMEYGSFDKKKPALKKFEIDINVN